MNRSRIRVIIDRLYSEMPDFMNEERHRGRAMFELQIQTNDHLPPEMSARQREAALELVEQEVARKFGVELTKADVPQPRASQNGSNRNLVEAELWRDLEMQLERCFPSTTDGTINGANAKAMRARASLKAFLTQECPLARFDRWRMRGRLKSKGLVLIEQLRVDDIFER